MSNRKKFKVSWREYDKEYCMGFSINVYWPESASFITLKETLSFINELEQLDNIKPADIKLELI